MPILDIRAILIANIIGITLLLAIARGHFWRLKKPTHENRIILFMFIVCLVSCIVDPLCSLADGQGGIINTIIVLLGNTWLYLANIAMAHRFHALVSSHLGIRLYRIHKILLIVPTVILCALLAVNLFIPLVFSAEGSTYSRTDLYWAYLAVEAAITLDGLLFYLYVRRSSGRLKFFPVASFLAPAAIGIFIQSVSYGVSTIFPFYAVSFGCVVSSLQNELVFKDQLTGLYNRSYFNTMENKLQKANGREYVAMMLDINGFKHINDSYGHNVGDKALIEVSNIFQEVIRERGTVIRYAGDEFIIILYNADDRNTEKTIEAIHSALEDFNRTSGNPYTLTVSIGHCKVNLKEHSMNELVDKIDKLMYENKRIYYNEHKKEKTGQINTE